MKNVDLMLLGDGQAIRDHLDVKILDVDVVIDLFSQARKEADFPAAETTIAVVPVDPRGRTSKFVDVLKSKGIQVLEVPFFWGYPSSLKWGEGKPQQPRHSSIVGYVLGTLAARAEAENEQASCVVFGSDFGMAIPAMDFVSRKHRFLLMFTRALVDERWMTEVGLQPLNVRGMYQAEEAKIPFWDMTGQLDRFTGGEVKKTEMPRISVPL